MEIARDRERRRIAHPYEGWRRKEDRKGGKMEMKLKITSFREFLPYENKRGDKKRTTASGKSEKKEMGERGREVQQHRLPIDVP